jgi:hypothetical protein
MNMKLTFRLKGGEGSGHFDHRGIPDHQGGSLPEGESGGKSEEPKKKKRWTSKHNWSEFDSRGPNKVYQSVGENTTDSEPNARGSHKTTAIQSLINILSGEGLKGQHTWYGRKPSVYFTSIEEEAANWAANRVRTGWWEGTGRNMKYQSIGGHYAVIEFELPDKLNDKVIPDQKANKDFHWTSAFRIEDTIPVENINSVKVYDKDMHLYTVHKEQWEGKSKDEISEMFAELEKTQTGEYKPNRKTKSIKYYAVVI